ncbi:MAG: DUF1622 domain-containing protein [Hyphomicrobiales bacterium]
MGEQILHFLEQASWFISLFAVSVIVIGFAISLARYLVQYNNVDSERGFSHFKAELGRYLLLGLEILVLADVLESITTKPTLTSIAMLAFLVVLRTVVGWTLTLEIERRWPWQSARKEKPEADNA